MYLKKLTNLKNQQRYCVTVSIAIALVAWEFLLFVYQHVASFRLPPESLQAVSTYERKEEAFALPVRLVIPNINVDAHVQSVGLAENGSGEMGIPSNFTDVGWYEAGVRPGMRGNAVIAGHFNGKTVKEAVFFDLQTLEIGDEVFIISADGNEVAFKVVKIESYDYDDATNDVFISNDGKARLNLITCGGQWLPHEKVYDKRTVVFTESIAHL